MNRFSSAQIKFDKDYLNKLTGDPDSGVSKQNCKYHIALHPAQFNDFGQSIKDELGRKISRYDDIFQGIMLGYENIKLQSDLGVIGLDNLYVHIDIQADFFVFRPENDMILKGVVTRTTKDHVGCLVYGTFNISLPKLDKDDEDWLGHKANVQNDVVFKIIHVDLNSRLPYIRGQIISVSNPRENGLFTHPKINKKLNKKINFEENDEEEDVATQKSKKRRKKKNNNIEESMENLEIKEEIEEGDRTISSIAEFEDNSEALDDSIPTLKKKRKRKQNNEYNNIEESIENLEIKEEIEEGDRTISSIAEFEDNSEALDDSIPTLKKKRKRKQNNDEETLKNIKIKEEIVDEEDISDRNEKSKKHKKKRKAEYDDQDEEILRKREKRKEKKKKREQDKLNLSLESLDIKSLFDDSSVNISASVSSSSMANNEDRRKKHIKSNSMSHDLYLENVKLEEDSELERIISNKKRKRAKTESNH